MPDQQPERLKRASDSDLLDAGQQLLVPTVTISKHIKGLRLNPNYSPFAEDLDKIVVATKQLANLIKQSLSKSAPGRSAAEIHSINAIIKHDLSTPLIAVTAYSEMIQEDLEAEGDTEACELLEHVLDLSQTLLKRIKELDYLGEMSLTTPVEPASNSLNPTAIAAADSAERNLMNLMSEVIAGMRNSSEQRQEASLLVVDDKESNRDFLSRRLIKQGFSVDVAENGQQALNLLRDHDYDLVLLDIIMPELDGYQVLERLKQDERLKHTPVMMISALDEIDSVVKCLEMGAEDYLQKPFNQIILTTKINASLERSWLRAREQAHNRTLKLEQEKTEKLLLNILPKSIAERLKNGESSIADRFDDVTVLFADIVNFSELSANISPEQLVEKLNAIFLAFDLLTESHGLEKIKTIGDAYMLVGGMPTPCPDHVNAVADMALEMQQVIHQMNAEDGGNLSIRIGIHTGPVVAAVIGKHKFSYDLWGDAVIVASRMESNSLPDHIQISDATYQRIKENFIFDKRAPIEVKGQGSMQTYFLKAKKAP